MITLVGEQGNPCCQRKFLSDDLVLFIFLIKKIFINIYSVLLETLVLRTYVVDIAFKLPFADWLWEIFYLVEVHMPTAEN